MADRVLPSREGMQRKIDGHQEDWLADDDDLWALAEEWASGRLVDREAMVPLADFIRTGLYAYPEDIFVPPPSGEHGESVDACSAAMARHLFGRAHALLVDAELDV